MAHDHDARQPLLPNEAGGGTEGSSIKGGASGVFEEWRQRWLLCLPSRLDGCAVDEGATHLETRYSCVLRAPNAAALPVAPQGCAFDFWCACRHLSLSFLRRAECHLHDKCFITDGDAEKIAEYKEVGWLRAREMGRGGSVGPCASRAARAAALPTATATTTSNLAVSFVVACAPPPQQQQQQQQHQQRQHQQRQHQQLH
jgi:hypothetical protein